jgi:hypothetical protein
MQGLTLNETKPVAEYSHRQLLRYENERPELIFNTKKKYILKNNLCPKMLLRELSCIESFAIS